MVQFVVKYLQILSKKLKKLKSLAVAQLCTLKKFVSYYLRLGLAALRQDLHQEPDRHQNREYDPERHKNHAQAQQCFIPT